MQTSESCERATRNLCWIGKIGYLMDEEVCQTLIGLCYKNRFLSSGSYIGDRFPNFSLFFFFLWKILPFFWVIGRLFSSETHWFIPLTDHCDQSHITVMPSACVDEHNQEQACEGRHVIWDDDATENIIFPIKLSPFWERWMQFFLVLKVRCLLFFLSFFFPQICNQFILKN